MFFTSPCKKSLRPQIPFFEDAANKRIPGVPTIERETIHALVYHRATRSMLCLDWGAYGCRTFVIGGIEANETPIAAARREVLEETGYPKLKFVANLGETCSAYYAPHKKENRIANTTGLLFELMTEEQIDIPNADTLPHVYTWLPKNKVLSYVTGSSQRYYWRKAQEYLKPYMAPTESSLAKEREKFSCTPRS